MFKKQISIPLLKQAESIYKSMTASERWLFYTLTAIVAITSLILLIRVYNNSTVVVPSTGGSITEGVVGAPRFINPVLAISQTDKDLSELIYAGLMTTDEQGKLVPELAESYTVSEDAKEYTFILKEGLEFHDGTPLTASDVVFTIEKALQPDIKSPERANWEGVNVKQDGDLKVVFTLSKPYSQFLQNTTIGILPEEHWYKLTADEFIFSNLNTSPIGSGAYKFISMDHNNSGIPSSITLTRFNKFTLGEPYIKNIIINFYPSRDLAQDALIAGTISSLPEVSIDSIDKLLNNRNKLYTSTLPRIFAVFFNQSNNKALEDKDVRKALRGIINKEDLVSKVLNNYAKPIDGPTIPTKDITLQEPLSIEDAKALIEKAGWKLDEEQNIYTNKKSEPLTITLTTANSAELKDVAEYIATAWRSIGVTVKVEIFEPGDIAQSVLRTRDYEALLFGEILGVDPDLYAFWHSSQRNDPGLNIANYTNTKVDKLLLQARKSTDAQERTQIYEKITSIINKDVPAIFLYAPYFTYISDSRVLGINLPTIMEPQQRFSNIYKWHVKTSRSLQFINN